MLFLPFIATIRMPWFMQDSFVRMHLFVSPSGTSTNNDDAVQLAVFSCESQPTCSWKRIKDAPESPCNIRGTHSYRVLPFSRVSASEKQGRGKIVATPTEISGCGKLAHAGLAHHVAGA